MGEAIVLSIMTFFLPEILEVDCSIHFMIGLLLKIFSLIHQDSVANQLHLVKSASNVDSMLTTSGVSVHHFEYFLSADPVSVLIIFN